MNRNLAKKITGWLIVAIIISLNYSPHLQNVKNYPENIIIVGGETKNIGVKLPFFIKAQVDDQEVLQFGGDSLSNQQMYFMNNGFDIQAGQEGTAHLDLSVLGIIPIKSINVQVSKNLLVQPGGEAIGVTLYTDGVLVVGTSEFEGEDGKLYCPAQRANIRPGDVIKKINGEEVNDVKGLIDATSDGKVIKVEIEREGVIFITQLTPIYNPADEQYHLGVWARDSTVGVGTMTFYDFNRGAFAALGHPICDVDTNTLLQVEDGNIVLSEIVDVVQGQKGQPGELRGVFDIKNKKIGSIVANTNKGIYGKINQSLIGIQSEKLVQVAHPEEVQVGPATILSTIDNEGIKTFDIMIEKINLNEIKSGRGMIIRITDEALIERTGGVVQGMSGSPIMQNGKIVGAVTHVFVNDPKKGYGIFAEWMMVELEKEIS